MIDLRAYDSYSTEDVAEILGMKIDNIVKFGSEGNLELCIRFTGAIEETLIDFDEMLKRDVLVPIDKYKVNKTKKFPLKTSDILQLYDANVALDTTEHKIEIHQVKQVRDIIRTVEVEDDIGKPRPHILVGYRNLHVLTDELIRFMKEQDFKPTPNCGYDLTESKTEKTPETNILKDSKKPAKFWDDAALQEKAFKILSEENPKIRKLYDAVKKAGLKSGEKILKEAVIKEFDEAPAGYFKYLKRNMLLETSLILNLGNARRDFEERIFSAIIEKELNFEKIAGGRLRKEFNAWEKDNKSNKYRTTTDEKNLAKRRKNLAKRRKSLAKRRKLCLKRQRTEGSYKFKTCWDKATLKA